MVEKELTSVYPSPIPLLRAQIIEMSLPQKPKWDRLSEEQRHRLQDQLISFYEEERDEQIGVIAAGQLIDFFLQGMGSELYDQGVKDAQVVMKKRMEDLDFDLDDLMNA